MNEPLPLATLHDAVLEFIQDRKDVVLFGAQAVNAYVSEPRMTQDVDLCSNRGRDFAEELRLHLAARFRIALRLRDIRDGVGFRIYQVRSDGNRHLVDIRPVGVLPPSQLIERIQVMAPDALIAGKVLAAVSRHGKPKSFTDQRDLAVLLLRFPELKTLCGPVRDRLAEADASHEAIAAWEELVHRDIAPDDEGDSW